MGDIVDIIKCRPISKNKHWKITKVLGRNFAEIAEEKLKITPTYRVLEESGPDHQKLFSVGVYFGEKLAASGNGPSKQDAEVEAAKAALEQIK